MANGYKVVFRKVKLARDTAKNVTVKNDTDKMLPSKMILSKYNIFMLSPD